MKTNIIIVDDLDVNRLLLKEYIKNIENIDVIEATDGQQCLDLINGNTKIIISDVMMPVLNGIEATKIIKLKHPHIFVIGVTGQNQSEEHNVFDAVLYKPYLSVELIKLIKKNL
jgi:CheY-like chemotaxis protein